MLARHLRAGRLRPLIEDQEAFYRRPWTPTAVRDWQLACFNEQWAALRRWVPFFQDLHRERPLPDRFASWEEVWALLPLMDRKTVQRQRPALTSRLRPPDQWRSTGGSTGEPIRVPVWSSEARLAASAMWYARSWFGVMPSDRLFLIWGHSHLLGRGRRGLANRVKRQLGDALLGYHRFSAYDLGERRLAEAARALLSCRPAYLLSYSVALDRFARANEHHATAFRQLELKVAIATAESFPRPDSAALVAEVLGCPVAMEYGAVETGPIAHQRPDGRFQVFWRHYALEGLPSEQLPGAWEVVVTSLYPRSLPLVRYRLGDLVPNNPNHPAFPQLLDSVIGRCNDYVVLPGGSVIHSEAFTHAIKECFAVLNYQVVQRADGALTLLYVADRPLSPAELAELRSRLERVHPALADIAIERTAQLETTLAGKTRRVVRAAEVQA